MSSQPLAAAAATPAPGAGAVAREPGTPYPPVPPEMRLSAEEQRRALEQAVQHLLAHPPGPRIPLLSQVQQALQHVRLPDSLRLGVLEAAASELAAAGDAERAAVCADFAARFRAHPLDGDTFLAFGSRCDQWEGIAKDQYANIMAGCTHESMIPLAQDAAADAGHWGRTATRRTRRTDR